MNRGWGWWRVEVVAWAVVASLAPCIGLSGGAACGPGRVRAAPRSRRDRQVGQSGARGAARGEGSGRAGGVWSRRPVRDARPSAAASAPSSFCWSATLSCAAAFSCSSSVTWGAHSRVAARVHRVAARVHGVAARPPSRSPKPCDVGVHVDRRSATCLVRYVGRVAGGDNRCTHGVVILGPEQLEAGGCLRSAERSPGLQPCVPGGAGQRAEAEQLGGRLRKLRCEQALRLQPHGVARRHLRGGRRRQRHAQQGGVARPHGLLELQLCGVLPVQSLERRFGPRHLGPLHLHLARRGECLLERSDRRCGERGVLGAGRGAAWAVRLWHWQAAAPCATPWAQPAEAHSRRMWRSPGHIKTPKAVRASQRRAPQHAVRRAEPRPCVAGAPRAPPPAAAAAAP